jgi:hypothetical protein
MNKNRIKEDALEGIKRSINRIYEEKSKQHLLSISPNLWIKYAIGALSYKKNIDELSKIISIAHYNIQNGGLRYDNKERKSNSIITPLIKATGKKEQWNGCEMTIDKMVALEGKEEVVGLIKHNYYYKNYCRQNDKKYKRINKKIEKLEKSNLIK